MTPFTWLTLLAATTTMMRSHPPSTGRPVGMSSLQELQTTTYVNKRPIEEVDDQSLVRKTRRQLTRHRLAICAGVGWKAPPPDTCDAIRNAAMTAGRLMNLKN